MTATPNLQQLRSIIEPYDLTGWKPWEERFSCSPVDKPVSGLPKREPVETADIILSRYRVKPIPDCTSPEHIWLNHGGAQVKCAHCKRTALRHNLPLDAVVSSHAKPRIIVIPIGPVKPCTGLTHDWHPKEGSGEKRKIRCGICRRVTKGRPA